MAKAQSRRTLDHLRDLVEDSDLRHRDIEDRAGWSRGYLSQVLGDRVELRLQHIEILLSVLNVDPVSFFRDLFPRRRQPGRRHPNRPSERPDSPRLTVNRDMLEVSGLGTEALHHLRLRIGRCERALAAVARQAAIKRRIRNRE